VQHQHDQERAPEKKVDLLGERLIEKPERQGPHEPWFRDPKAADHKEER